MKHLDSVPVASRLQPGPAHRVTLLRWGAGISLGLVLLACGGPADLQLGRDSDALESSGDRPGSDPTRAAEAPSADTSNASPSLPPGAASGPGYLVDPTTGQVFLPCETPVAADTASAEPSATDQPSANVDPTIPDQPSANVDPTIPDQPSATDQPAANVDPTIPDQPSATDQPSANVDPTIPDQPSATDQPAANVDPTIPDQPSATDQPAANVDPTIPDQPSATDQPAASGESTGAGTPQPCGPVGASPNDRSAEP
jgi:hypothetical protein